MSDMMNDILAIRKAFTRLTSELPAEWSMANASVGNCHVASLLLKDLWGGIIVQGWIDGYTHYWNVINGATIDITRDQFPEYSTVVAHCLADSFITEDTLAKLDVLYEGFRQAHQALAREAVL